MIDAFNLWGSNEKTVPVLVTTDGGDEFKLPESLVIVEYVADLVGADVFFASTAPRFKATSRYLVERYMQLVQPHYFASAVRREAAALAKLRDGLIEFNSLLKSFDDGSNKGAFIQGTDRFGYADLNIAPFVARVLSVSRHGLNPEWEGTPIHQEVEQGADGFERLKRWWEAVQKVEAWNQVWVEDKYIEVLSKGLAAAAAQSASK